MSTIHFVGGEKGGVGKSVLSRTLSQYFLDNDLAYIGLDADQSHPTLTRYYDGYTRPINLDLFESIDTIMEIAMEQDVHLLIDLPAQSQRFLERWFEESDVLSLCSEVGIDLVYWYTVDGGPDSINLLDRFLAKYSSQLNCIVVKNYGCGNDFSGIEALAHFNADPLKVPVLRQMSLPALHESTINKIDKLGLSFWGAINVKDSESKHLSLMERQRSKVWLKKSHAAIKEVLTGISN
ncbi:mobilization protein MobD [Neptuniibacter sp. 2_MG-2023]|uniref:mobilization protein MobD n=1 Tax=Neptuniibacter sp. 2_MG-2023 TaxID=3062671 RepID=UPI0026E1A9FA|nr:mobilization protein MobD [Neptuniibacter sp. 2_MG-2023]MDO6514416.1 mobilization protein MobD [Neptuniibacter sp. 2_MG-2023]